MSMHIRVANRYLESYRLPPMPREFHLPKDVRDTAPVNPEGTDLAIWTYESKGKFFGVAFAGKSVKPLWHYAFQSPEARQKFIDQTITDRKARIKMVQDRRDERKAWEHGLQVGDLLYSSWGYDQTNVDFYEVTAVSGKAVVIREIETKVVRSGQGSEAVVGVPHRFVGEAMKKIPIPSYKGEPAIKLNSFSHAYKWDGQPKYQTASGWGH